MLGSDATSQEAPLKPIRSLISGCIVFLVAHLTCAQTTPAKTGAHAQFSGYTAHSSSPERDWEKKFQDGIVSDNVRENMRRMSARPHHVGSPYDKDNAEWILAHIQVVGARLPTLKPSDGPVPNAQGLALSNSSSRSAISPSFRSRWFAGDPTSVSVRAASFLQRILN